MFPFFKRRDEGPLVVEDAVFTPEDIFVLLGESLDIGCFAAQPRNLDLGRFKVEGSSAWRERLVKRFEPRGLVDASGEPVPELARALEPLRGHGAFVGDGRIPHRTNPVDGRTAVLCLMPDLSRATAVVRSGRGFGLRPFPDDRSLWEAEFLSLYGLERRFTWAERSQHFIEGDFRIDDTSFTRALKAGEDAVNEWCEVRGIAERDQLRHVSRVGGGPFGGFYSKEFLCADYSACVFNDKFDYAVPIPKAGDYWSKGAVFVPEVGLVDYWGVAPRGPEYDWYGNKEAGDRCRYSGFDFPGPGEGLLDNLLTFYDYPESGYEYVRPSTRRRPGGGV